MCVLGKSHLYFFCFFSCVCYPIYQDIAGVLHCVGCPEMWYPSPVKTVCSSAWSCHGFCSWPCLALCLGLLELILPPTPSLSSLSPASLLKWAGLEFSKHFCKMPSSWRIRGDGTSFFKACFSDLSLSGLDVRWSVSSVRLCPWVRILSKPVSPFSGSSGAVFTVPTVTMGMVCILLTLRAWGHLVSSCLHAAHLQK